MTSLSQSTPTENGIQNSPRVLNIINANASNHITASFPTRRLDCFSIFCNKWSDDFEPNYGSHNKGSVFMKTVTIITNLKKDTPRFTLPVILGKKGDDHSKIESIIQADIDQMRDPQIFYDGQNDSPIRLNVNLIASIQDQPARREVTGIAGGNGTYTRRWGYIGDWLYNQKCIPFCNDCFDIFEDMSSFNDNPEVIIQWLKKRCDNCTKWMYDIDHPRLQFPQPPNFPSNGNPPLNGICTTLPDDTIIDIGQTATTLSKKDLKPFKISSRYLNEVIRYAHEAAAKGLWTLKETKIYLKVNGLSQRTIMNIIDSADHEILKNDPSLKTNEAFMSDLCNVEKDNPWLASPWTPPSCWNRPYGFSIFTNAPMHLLSGVNKTTNILCLKWIGQQVQLSIFEDKAQKYMDTIESLRLSWCRLPTTFGGKFVGSLSENQIALSRITPWLYTLLLTIP